jgi:hypothetical protein
MSQHRGAKGGANKWFGDALDAEVGSDSRLGFTIDGTKREYEKRKKK